jgi:hypothetical protein
MKSVREGISKSQYSDISEENPARRNAMLKGSTQTYVKKALHEERLY